MATVTFDQATRVYPKSDRPAVDRLNLEVRDGEFLVLVGPSGCGKTTSLRMLAGLEHVDEGTILVDGKEVVNLAPRERDIAMVFQNYALYPHMSVAREYGLRAADGESAEAPDRRTRSSGSQDPRPRGLPRKKATAALRWATATRGDGPCHRARAAVFLMDEPLSNLDAKLRVATRGQISALQRRLGVTTLYVTHDQVEAMTMGDRVAVMREGELQQVASPEDSTRTRSTSSSPASSAARR